jgi:hypothetical protein
MYRSQLGQHSNQLRSEFVQLPCVSDGENIEFVFSSGRQLQNDIPAIGPGMFAHDQARLLASIHELNDAVVAQTKALSRITDRRGYFMGCSRDLEQELMLLGLESAVLRRGLTKVEK